MADFSNKYEEDKSSQGKIWIKNATPFSVVEEPVEESPMLLRKQSPSIDMK